MDAKQVKAALKAAREAIRNKDFKEALKQCKSILKHDKNHYNALVFVGVAADGMEQPDQALMAYKKATEVDPEQILAWQGLSGFLEKSDNKEYKQELVAVYEKLEQLSASEKKSEITKKCAQLLVDLGENDQATDKYNSLLSITKDDQQRLDIVRCLSKLLLKTDSDIVKQKSLKYEVYKEFVSHDLPNDDDHRETWSALINMMVKDKKSVHDIENECNNCITVHGDHIYPLEILCQLTMDNYLECDIKELNDLVSRLKLLSEELPVVQIGLGIMSLNNKNYQDAKECLTSALKSSSEILVGWIQLAAVCVKLHDITGLENAIKEGMKCSGNKSCIFTGDKTKAIKSLKHHQAKGLLDVGDQASLQKAMILCNELLSDGPDNDVLMTKSYIYISEENHQSASEVCEQLKLSVGISDDLIILQGWCHLLTKDYNSALDCFTSVTRDDSWLQYSLGKAYYYLLDINTDYKDKCLSSLIKAAKLDPFHSEIFLYLGHFYKKMSPDKMKALKCYQKAYNLKKMSERAGCALVDLMVELGQEDGALDILRYVTQQAQTGSGKWAWLRLGLHQLRTGDPSGAGASLQCALRASPKDCNLWECLADAYTSRGSFTAAMRAFTHAAELDPTSVYSLYQIAEIKQTLGLYDEAVEEYQKVLGKTDNYVPALKGLGETHLMLARTSLNQFFHGRAIDHCQAAISLLTRAVTYRPDICCLWKCLGDACTIIHPVPSDIVRMSVPSKLMTLSKDIEEISVMNKLEILSLGAKCYGCALKLQPECSGLWQDLGVNYYHQSHLLDGIEKQSVAEKCQLYLQKSVILNPLNYKHWLALATAASNVLDKPSLAQHCYIKSIEAESNNVIAWTNLGALYLKNDNIELAHEAFKKAQSLEPSYVQSWIGQAMIAEKVGHEDSMDLFRHCTSLSNHVESAIGYSHWICSVLKGDVILSPELHDYSVNQMDALTVSCDNMEKYTDRVRDNATAYNMYGLLLERQGRLLSAVKAFQCAVTILEKPGGRNDQLNQVRANYGHCLIKRGLPDEAMTQFQLIQPLEKFEDICGLALAAYKTGKYDVSYQTYSQALEIASNDRDRSHVCSALGMVAWKSGDLDKAKTALFQSSQICPASVQGLQALCSLAILQSDQMLALAVLQELQHDDSYHFLKACLHLQTDGPESALHELEKGIHTNPGQARYWTRTSDYILSSCPGKTTSAVRCAMIAKSLDPLSQDVDNVLTRSKCAAGCHDDRNMTTTALREAQKAVHLYPGKPEKWMTFLSALYAENLLASTTRGKHVKSEDRLLDYSKFVLDKVESSASFDGQYLWCVKHHLLVLMSLGKTTEATDFVGVALQKYPDDIDLSCMEMCLTNKDSLPNLQESSNLLFVIRLISEHHDSRGFRDQAIDVCKLGLQLAMDMSIKQAILLQLVGLTYKYLASGKEEYDELFKESVSEVSKLKMCCSSIHLLQGLRELQQGDRHAKRCFYDATNGDTGTLGEAASRSRKELVKLFLAKNDRDNIRGILKKAELDGDSTTVDYIEDILNKTQDTTAWDG